MSKPASTTDNKLKQVRASLGWTQQQMADELDISVRAYIEQENSEEPKRAYVLAAQQVRGGQVKFNPGAPLPHLADETQAQAWAAMHYARTLFKAVDTLGSHLKVDLRLAEAADQLQKFAAEPVESAQDQIARRAYWIAGEALDIDTTFSMLG